MSLRRAVLALTSVGLLSGCHRPTPRVLSGPGPPRLSDEERLAITMALYYVRQTAPAAGRPICLGPGYGGRDSAAMRSFAQVVRATVPPHASEAPDLACGGAWRTPGASDSTAVALRVRRLAVRGLEYAVSLGAWQARSSLSGFEVHLHPDFDEFQLVQIRPIYH